MQIVIMEPFVDESDALSDSSSSASSDPTDSLPNSTSSISSSSSSHSSESMSDAMPDPFLEEFGHDLGGVFDDSSNSDHIFPGSSLNVLGTLAILFTWFSSFPGISKQALGQLLFILHHFILPSGNILPATYAAAFQIIQPLIVPVQEHHCCPNDCMVYRGPHAKASHCPVCGEARYKNGGNVPKKRFKYIPLGPRIKRYFGNANISQLLQRHSQIQTSNSVHNIQETQTWKEWFSKKGIFCGDPRGLALSLCMDGTNPYSKEKTSYSMWPMVVSFLNLPPNLHRLAGFLHLVGIVPGKKEPKNH